MGLLEVVVGLAFLFGIAPRLAALTMIGNMIGAIATAGRVDGGQDIWLPIVLIVLLAVVVRSGAGKWCLLRLRAPGASPVAWGRARS